VEVIEIGTHSLQKTSRSNGIPLISLSDHLNNKIRSHKMGPTNVITEEEDKTIVEWTLTM
jgi:hypothetical protein